MNSNPLFDFSINKENKIIHIKREFDANLEVVWRALRSIGRVIAVLKNKPDFRIEL